MKFVLHHVVNVFYSSAKFFSMEITECAFLSVMAQSVEQGLFAFSGGSIQQQTKF
jgi:hypothetical protein